MNKLLRKIQTLIDCEENFSQFLYEIDSFQHGCLSDLMRNSKISTNYAKAFLLKLSNFLIGKYQYTNRHDTLIAYPYSLIVDPSNSCPLHCPGCIHNNLFREKIDPDWPLGLLDESVFDRFIDMYGPFASNGLFYNWGEPLLNKQTPSFIRKAKSYLLNTSLSSNLSVKFDAEELVLSGLDYMIISIDGATAESYGVYRKGGDFDLVIDNVKKLVAAKRKHKMSTPLLSWQFLLFEHTKNEVNRAKDMAKEIGVNDIRFSQPYDVIWDDNLVVANGVQSELYVVGYEKEPEYKTIDIANIISKDFPTIFEKSWLEKLPQDWETCCRKRTGKTCQWLYSSLVMDAHGRYLPCCYVPRKDSGFSYVFGENTPKDVGPGDYNSDFFRFSRKHFTWLSELGNPGGVAPKLSGQRHAPYCVACPDKNTLPLVNSEHLKRYVRNLDKFKVLNDESIAIISDWDVCR